jgi:sugar/nucleoside kinase (ribokinase family)
MTILEKPIVCLGILVADVVGRPLRSIPDPGRLVLVDEMQLHTGGCAVNSASALARLGVPAEVIGKVGDDPFGDFLIHTLQARGIGAQGVQRDRQAGTSVTMVMVDPEGERRFVHYIGANARLTLEDVDLDQIRSASILHVAGTLVLPGIDGEPTAWLLAEARKTGVVTALDTVWDATGRWMQVLKPCLPHLDYCPQPAGSPGNFRSPGPSRGGAALLDEWCAHGCIKMGAEGCLVAT